MENSRLEEQGTDDAINPYYFLRAISEEDSRWGKLKDFWELDSVRQYRQSIKQLRKIRSKQILIAIANGQYCKSNIGIQVNHQEKTIHFLYRGKVIGQFDQKIMTFIPVYADVHEGSYSTIGQRMSAKRAIEEIVKVLLDDEMSAERINLAYKEFLMLLFGALPRQPSALWVSREAYSEAMKAIEDKYRLNIGDPNFLEWRLTLLGRSPRIINTEPKE